MICYINRRTAKWRSLLFPITYFFFTFFTINGFVNTLQIDRHNTETARQYDTHRRTNELQADNMVYKVTDNLTHRKNMHGAKSDIIWPIDGDSATCNVACWFLHDISNVTLYCKRITCTFCRVSYSAFF